MKENDTLHDETGRLPDMVSDDRDQEAGSLKLFVKEMGGRREYRYGEDWQTAALWMEGGYATPEEAERAWMKTHPAKALEEQEKRGSCE